MKAFKIGGSKYSINILTSQIQKKFRLAFHTLFYKPHLIPFFVSTFIISTYPWVNNLWLDEIIAQKTLNLLSLRFKEIIVQWFFLSKRETVRLVALCEIVMWLTIVEITFEWVRTFSETDIRKEYPVLWPLLLVSHWNTLYVCKGEYLGWIVVDWCSANRL
jgi:hypothetical protein